MAAKLSLTTIEGNRRRCGQEYGNRFAQAILGFCQQEVRPNRTRLNFARRCWKHVARDAPGSAEFIEGMAEGAQLSVAHLTLLSLHEEIVHQPHCTAFVATGKATRGGKTINAQNWDWAPALFGWPGLVQIRIKGGYETLTYHYPGLWASAGINEFGLSLMWTGAGYFPTIRPRTGMPTYVLIAEILQRETVDEAVGYLQSIKCAGAFIFFLADSTSACAVVEVAPGHIVVDRADRTASRANHYVCPEMKRCTGQKLPRGGRYTTVQRANRMNELVRSGSRPLTLNTAKQILTDRHGPWPWLHQFPAGGEHELSLRGMTVDSLIAVSQDRVLHTCRGGRAAGPWQSVSL